MTSPEHAKTGEYGRYYTRPQTGEQLISVTNALGALGKPALVPWAGGVVAKHAVEHWPRLTAMMRREPDAVLEELKAQIGFARDAATGLGSRIHHFAEQHTKADLALDQMPEEVRPYVAQFIRWLESEPDLVIEASECTVASMRHGFAGTADLFVWLPIFPAIGGFNVERTADGTKHLWVIDIKTSATRPADSIYPEMPLQLAGLALADEAWTDDGQIHPLTRRPIGGAVLNLRPNAHKFIPVPIGQDEQDAFRAAVRVSVWQHEFKKSHNAEVQAKRATRKPRRTKAQIEADKQAANIPAVIPPTEGEAA